MTMIINDKQIRQLMNLSLEYFAQLNFLDAKKDKKDEILALIAEIYEQSNKEILPDFIDE